MARKKNDPDIEKDTAPHTDEQVDTDAVEQAVDPENPTDASELPEDPAKDTAEALANDTPDNIETDEHPEPADAPEPQNEPAETPAPQQPRRASAVPVVIGGAIAAILGFMAARADLLDNVLPPSMRAGAEVRVANDRIDDLQQALTAAQAKIAGLQNQIENTPEPDTSDLETAISVLSDRLNALEARPVTSTTGSAGNYDAAFAQLQKTAKAQQAELDRLLAEAQATKDNSEAAAQAALARAAATRIVAAVESGEPFADALADLAETGVVVPDGLQKAAAKGVATLAALQTDMPDAARAALAAARSANTEGGFGSFLQRQLGARSVTPKEGTDPDAVLSRVEAAVREGRLDTALAEAEGLPEEGKAALGDWLEQARTRLDATNATEALMQRLAGN